MPTQRNTLSYSQAKTKFDNLMAEFNHGKFNLDFAKEFLLEIRSAGRYISDSIERKNLAQIARDVSDKIYESSGEYPLARLEPLETSDIDTGHDENAERLLNEAEVLFYAGHYVNALKKYDQVLAIEPSWERPKEHRSQAERYLVEGHIPAIALPAEAAILFGKAQSAARVGRYHAALELFLQAKEILVQMGITKWAEGQGFEFELQTSIQAEEVALEGIKLFNHGKFDEAIEKLDTAFQATGNLKYRDETEKYRQFKMDYKRISEILLMNVRNLDEIIWVLKKLDSMDSEYRDNPSLQVLRNRLQNLIPSITEVLIQEIRGLRISAERASTIDEALLSIQQAQLKIDQAIKLGIPDIHLMRLRQELYNLNAKISQLEDAIYRAEDSYLRKKSWPAEAWLLSAEVRERFPNDPKVITLQKKLAVYKTSQIVLRVVLFLVIALVLILAIKWSLSLQN